MAGMGVLGALFVVQIMFGLVEIVGNFGGIVCKILDEDIPGGGGDGRVLSKGFMDLGKRSVGDNGEERGLVVGCGEGTRVNLDGLRSSGCGESINKAAAP